MINKNGVLRVLLIEDNKDDEELIRREIERGGGRVALKRIETEAEFILALESETWDLVICDYSLPHFSAKNALSMTRDRLGDIPFIVVSGIASEDLALEILKLGANDFVHKENLPRLRLAVRREILQAGERMLGRLEIEKSYMLTVEAWGVALERRDVYTRNHTLRVADLTLRLARAFRVSGSQFRSIHYGALLHDIGKMGIPDAILLKREDLDPEEMAIMKMHPGIAYDMLSHIPFLKDAINIPYCHHEKFDGTGYPRGLDGDRIPFEARLFSVCDVYDALTNDRPYRRAWETEKALEYIRSEAGKSFDPEVVEKFMEIMK